MALIPSYIRIPMCAQITHLCDFEYWRIFQGLNVEEIKEREESFEYPPRLQLTCDQIKSDASKSLFCSFEISKKSNNTTTTIAEFSVKKFAGT